MEYLEQFKSKFQSYYNEMREGRKTRECLIENRIATRRTTRAQFLTERRNITEVLSPSPILMVSAAKSHKSPLKKMDRLTRMKLWKAEKLKKMDEQKSKMKPLFKVGAKANIGFPKVNDTKSIVKKSFAPSNHIFKAPSNIKAIEINATKKGIEIFKRVTRSQKTVISSPLALPTRRRKTQVIELNKKNEPEKNQNRNKFTRQNAFESSLQEITNTVNKSTPAKSVTENKVENKNNHKENITSKLNDNKIVDTKNRRKSLRLNGENNEKQLKSPEKNISNKDTRKTPSKRKSLQKNIPEDNTKQETINKRQSKRRSFRKSTSNADKENDLNNTYELINPDQTTPIKDDVFSPVATYISPFVTTSRGKGSIKKENLERSIRGLPSFTEFQTPNKKTNTSFQINGASYFHTILNNEISRLTSMCKTWSTYKENSANLTEDAKDLIDVAVGQANLLMNKKFQQFRNLIISCENGYGEEKPVTCEDLQGFWDMIYIQVENLNTRFNRLTELKNRNWEEIIPVVQQKTVKKVGTKVRGKSTATSSLRSAIQAARKKSKSTSSTEDTVFNGGFFVVKSPQKKLSTPQRTKTPTKDQRSLLKAVLASETKKSSRKTVGSPGVNMMKASQTAKSIENLNLTMPTPGKSILKKTTNRKSSKAVLFKDYDDSAIEN